MISGSLPSSDHKFKTLENSDYQGKRKLAKKFQLCRSDVSEPATLEVNGIYWREGIAREISPIQEIKIRSGLVINHV